MFLNVEPHLDKEDRASRCEQVTQRSAACCVLTHVVGAEQRADRLQRAEGVVLAVALPAAGVPDQVAALLVRQDVGCRPLKKTFKR